MGNMMKKAGGGAQGMPQQGVVYAPYPPQQPQMQPMVQPQPAPMFVQQPQPAVQQYQPGFVQQPQFVGVQASPQLQPMAYPQAPVQQQPASSFRPAYLGPSVAPSSSAPPPLSLPQGMNQNSYENDAFLASLTGWSMQDIERLRREFLNYANAYGVIDREAFRKLYVASLLNMTWEVLERDAEQAFRNFDINRTGALDFNEYITACSRMAREGHAPAPPPMQQPAPLGPAPMPGSYPQY